MSNENCCVHAEVVGNLTEESGKIGEHQGTSYYLLYTPNGQEDRRLDMEWLKALDNTEKNRNVVVYCEKK